VKRVGGYVLGGGVSSVAKFELNHKGWGVLDNIVREVGDGVSTLWVGELPLELRFRRLFDLADNKLVFVAEMHFLGWGVDGEAWKWRRRLFSGKRNWWGSDWLFYLTWSLKNSRHMIIYELYFSTHGYSYFKIIVWSFFIFSIFK